MRVKSNTSKPRDATIEGAEAQPSTELLEMIAQDRDKFDPPDYTGDEQHAQYDDPLAGVAFGATLIEQLLYAIIEAHPISRKAGKGVSKTNEQRLNAAMKALFDRKRSRNALPGDTDDKALLWMREHQEKLKRAGKKTSVRALAIKAAAKFTKRFDPAFDMTPADRLREKFSGTYDKKQDKGRRFDALATLTHRVFKHDYVAESVERQILVRIANEFRAAGVAVTLPDD